MPTSSDLLSEELQRGCFPRLSLCADGGRWQWTDQDASGFGVDVHVCVCVCSPVRLHAASTPGGAEALAEGCGGQALLVQPVRWTLWAWQDPGVSCGDSGGREDERKLWKSALESGERLFPAGGRMADLVN